jgi:hypothetical protein
MPSQGTQRRITGTIDISTLLAFAFGVVFLTAILVFAVFFPNPSGFQIRVFVTTLALAAAGAGSVLAGKLTITLQLPITQKARFAIQAAGAVALFVIVYLLQPTIEKSVVNFVRPTDDPIPVAAAFLAKSDASDFAGVWAAMDPEIQPLLGMSYEQMRGIYETSRAPLGAVVSRNVSGTDIYPSPPGFPVGYYLAINYLTHFKNDSDCRYELVVLRATQDLRWTVATHKIAVTTTPCSLGIGGARPS